MSTAAFTVALVGADGAGKTTVARQLESTGSVPVKYMYMGLNPDAKNHMLPTTRMVQSVKRALHLRTSQGGPPNPERVLRRPTGVRRLTSGVAAILRLANRLGEEWYQSVITWSHVRRGFVVLFDRHFYADYFAHEIAPQERRLPLTRRIHGFVLKRFYPKPNYVILLDAPAEVLFARKGEGTVERIESRRQEYYRLRDRVERFEIVDANRPQEEVVEEVDRLISVFARERAR